MKIILIILITLILIVSLKNFNQKMEGFVNYYKCPNLKAGPINNDIFRDHKWNRVKKPEQAELYIPCGYTHLHHKKTKLFIVFLDVIKL